MGKQALCVPTEVFHEIGHFQGLLVGSAIAPYIRRLLNVETWSFRDRDECETNPAYKQIIPYTMVYSKMAGHDPLGWLHYYRTKQAGETRLHDKGSIGIGGHIEPRDLSGFVGGNIDGVIPPDILGRHLFQIACLRELFEEVALSPFYGSTYCHPGYQYSYADWCGIPLVGIINDDSDPVGEVHLGFVGCTGVIEPSCRAVDSELADPSFILQSELYDEHYNQMEGWSKILLDNFWS